MRNALFAALSLVLVLCTALCGADVFSFVPADSIAVVRIDPQTVLKRPEIAKHLNAPEVAAKRLEFAQKAGCSIEDINTAVAACTFSGDGVMLLGLNKKVDLAAAIKKLNVPVSSFKVGSHTMYYGADRSGIAQVASDVIMLGHAGDVREALAGKRGMSPELAQIVKQVSKNSCVAWLAFYVDKEIKGSAIYKFAGKNLADHSLSAEFIFTSEESARQIGAMLPMYAGMVSGMLFSADPELGADVLKSFRTNINGRSITLSLYVPQALAGRIADFAAAQGKKHLDKNGGSIPGYSK